MSRRDMYGPATEASGVDMGTCKFHQTAVLRVLIAFVDFFPA